MEYLIISVSLLIVNLVGVYCGKRWEKNKTKKNTIGNLVIDQSFTDEPPCLFLELDQSIDWFKRNEHIVLRVVQKNYLTQK